MILTKPNDNTQTYGIDNKKNFTIQANAKAFNLLANVAYKNKIEAVIRELSTNAQDSMIMAGKSEPFTVHLPNRLEPWFSVKDNGTGLSEKEFEELYGSLFASNKLDSNRTTGCFGIGSKSPFAYLADSADNSFSVINRYNGETLHYMVYKDEEGIPAYSIVHKELWNGSNGIEVRMNVNPRDFDTFHQTAKKVLSWFATPPIVEGGVCKFEFEKYEYTLRKSNYALLKNAGRSYVVMGNVGYPLDIAYNGEFNDSERRIASLGIHIFVDIGAVEFTLSREELALNKKTIEKIKVILKDIRAEMQAEIQKQLDACPNKWEAMKYCYQNSRNNNSYFYAFGNAKYKGNPITSEIDLVALNKNIANDLDKISVKKFSLTTKRHRVERHIPGSIPCVEQNFAIYDTDHAPFARLGKYLREKGLNSIYLIFNKQKELFDHAEIPAANAIKVSSLPKPPAQPRTGPGRAERSLLYLFNRNGSYNYSSSNWSAQQTDLKTGGIYLTIKRFKGIINNREVDLYSLKAIIEAIELLTGKTFSNLYGVREADMERFNKKIAKVKGWVSFDTIIKETIKQNSKLVSDLSLKNSFGKLTKIDDSIRRKLKDNHPINVIHREFTVQEKRIAAMDKKLSAFTRLTSYNAKTIKTDVVSNILTKKFNGLAEKYKLLYFIPAHQYWNNGACLSAVLAYIEQVDKHG